MPLIVKRAMSHQIFRNTVVDVIGTVVGSIARSVGPKRHKQSRVRGADSCLGRNAEQKMLGKPTAQAHT